MKKLTLDLNELDVQSFATGAGGGMGTVQGQQEASAIGTCNCTMDFAMEGCGGEYGGGSAGCTQTCPQGCTCTCQPDTCQNTCYQTCAFPNTCQSPQCGPNPSYDTAGCGCPDTSFITCERRCY